MIKAADPGEILSLDEKRGKGALTDEDVKKEIFSSVLIKWMGIGNAGAFSREKQVEVLFKDREIQDFVLQKSCELLEGEIAEWKRTYSLMERILLKSGKLKS